MAPRKRYPMPRGISEKILKRGTKGEEAIVLTFREGKPARVFGLEEYLKIRELPKKVKPWEHRKAKASAKDPLGAVSGKVLISLSRKNIYE